MCFRIIVFSAFVTLVARTVGAVSQASVADVSQGRQITPGLLHLEDLEVKRIQKLRFKRFQKLLRRENDDVRALFVDSGDHDDNTRKAQGSRSNPVHYVLTTDCTAYNLWQGHVHAALLEHTQPGQRFTWLASGCTTQEQQAMFQKVAHPNARIRFFHDRHPRDPKSGMELPHSQASNRPLMVHDWVSQFTDDLHSDEVVILSEPDQYMLRPMIFQGAPLDAKRLDVLPTVTFSKRPGLTDYVQPGRAASQDAAVGAKWYALDERLISEACGLGKCMVDSLKQEDAVERYGAGPPWAIHSTDLRPLSKKWEDLMVILKQSKVAAFESEQTAYGMAMAALGMDSVLYKHYTVSSVEKGSDDFEGWRWIGRKGAYDPCAARAPPAHSEENVPNFLHMCQTAKSEDGLFALHKDHVPKDILECAAPLLKHPPEDLLLKQLEAVYSFNASDVDKPIPTSVKNAWMVCAFTNAVNTGVELFKKWNCKKPNLDRTYMPPDHAAAFLHSNSNETKWHLPRYFHMGGWSDKKDAQLTGTPAVF